MNDLESFEPYYLISSSVRMGLIVQTVAFNSRQLSTGIQIDIQITDQIINSKTISSVQHILPYRFQNKTKLIRSMSLSIGEPLTIQNIQRGYLITMFSMWAIGVEFPRLLVRYGKSYSQVIDIHSISMSIIGLLTILYVLAYVIAFYTLANNKNKTPLQLAQMSLALLLAFLILVQFSLGYITRAQMTKPSLSRSLLTVKQTHKVMGNIMSLLGKTIITLELYIFSDQLFKAWLFLLGGLILLYIIFQFIYRSQTKTIIFQYPHKVKNKHQKYHKEIYDCLIKGVEDFEEFKHLGVRYFILDNCMYYIDENFLHPGGEYIFEIYNGKQINCLLKGTRQLTPQYPRHIHTKYVMKYLEHRIIGEIPVESILINQKVTNQYIEWKILKVKQQGVDGRLITMQNQAGYVRQLLKVENFGKYVMMSCPNEDILAKIQRPYTLIISLCEAQKRITDKFKSAYNFYYTGKCENTSLLQKTELPEVLSSNLTFMIKEYGDGLFTKFLFNSTVGKKYSITGPYGKGLALKPSTRGYYIFIGVGSGVTPYIDLFNYLLQKTLIELIAHKAGEFKARKVNSENISFSGLSDLKILFIGSFATSGHFYFRDLFKELYELNRVHNLSNFNMLLKYQNNEIQSDVMMIKESFDRAFFKTLLQEENPDKIYYCGPPTIEFTMRKLEKELLIKNKFVYL